MRELHHDLLDLGAGQAVVEPGRHVDGQLGLLAERGEDGDHAQRAVAARQLGPRPDLAERPAEGQRADAAEGALHVGEVLGRIGGGPAAGERAAHVGGVPVALGVGLVGGRLAALDAGGGSSPSARRKAASMWRLAAMAAGKPA